MRSTRCLALLTPIIVLGGLIAAAPAASGAPAAAVAAAAAPSAGKGHLKDDVAKNPLAEKAQATRSEALTKVLTGQKSARGDNRVVQMAKGQYVELARTGEDRILTLLGEFSDLAHNTIPEPDRSVDNSTIWTPDFSPDHYRSVLFADAGRSMRTYYAEQSSGRYAVTGEVGDWVRVPETGAYYGSNAKPFMTVWEFVRDTAQAWAATMSTSELNARLAPFDVWDRYDFDGDGNFDEPDGYLDHFQAVHAGVGEEWDGGVLGSDAIWSHRGYAYFTTIGLDGPANNKVGGIRIGDSDYWIGDYTIEPENGGVGIFAHEFAHDLGLPDLYETSGNQGLAENSTGFWTLMSQGSYGSSGLAADGLGGMPVHMGAWEKVQLGWLNYEVVRPGQRLSSHKLGPAEANTKAAQGIFVLLPDRAVSTDIGAPYAGSRFFYSGQGNLLDTSMSRSVTLPAGVVTLTAQVRYDIETDWDYAYLTVNGTPVATSKSVDTNPHDQNFGHGITGSTSGTWVGLTADLSAFAGQTVNLGWRYWTDVAAVGSGFSVDEIAVNDSVIGSAETEEGWTFSGFSVSTGTLVTHHFNAYVVENRQYRGFDTALRTGPYEFGYWDVHPNLVDHYAYQDGMLVSYWNTQYTDNNVGSHPGGGLVLPVDAHPAHLMTPEGHLLPPRIQTYDSTFGLEPTDPLALHRMSTDLLRYPSLPAQPLFDDTRSYWSGGASGGHYQPGWISVDVPKTGTTIRVTSASTPGFLQVAIDPAG